MKVNTRIGVGLAPLNQSHIVFLKTHEHYMLIGLLVKLHPYAHDVPRRRPSLSITKPFWDP